MTHELISSNLLGLFQYPTDIESTNLTISIFNPQFDSPIGNILIDISFQPTGDIAKKWLTKCLTDESVRNILRELPVNEIRKSPTSQQNKSESKPFNIEVFSHKLNQVDNYCQTEDINDDVSSVNANFNNLFQDSDLNIAPPKISGEPTIQKISNENFPKKSESPSNLLQYSLDSLDDLKGGDQNTNIINNNNNNNTDDDEDQTNLSHDSMDIIPNLSLPIEPNSNHNMTHHIIEFRIDDDVETCFDKFDSLGCFVCYNFPNLQDRNVSYNLYLYIKIFIFISILKLIMILEFIYNN